MHTHREVANNLPDIGKIRNIRGISGVEKVEISGVERVEISGVERVEISGVETNLSPLFNGATDPFFPCFRSYDLLEPSKKTEKLYNAEEVETS